MTTEGANFGQQLIPEKGLYKHKEGWYTEAEKGMDQLHRHTWFSTTDIYKLKPEEKRKSTELLMFLTEKRDNPIKWQIIYNGKPTREWMYREGTKIPPTSLESLIMTEIVYAKEECDGITAYFINIFIQMDITKAKED